MRAARPGTPALPPPPPPGERWPHFGVHTRTCASGDPAGAPPDPGWTGDHFSLNLGPATSRGRTLGKKTDRTLLEAATRTSRTPPAFVLHLPPLPALQAPAGPSPQPPAGPSPPSRLAAQQAVQTLGPARDALVQGRPGARRGRAVCCGAAAGPEPPQEACGAGGTCLRNSHLLDHSPPPPLRGSRVRQGRWRRPFLSKLQLFSYRHRFATKMISECQSIFSTGTPTTKNPEPIFDFERLTLVAGSARGHSDSISCDKTSASWRARSPSEGRHLQAGLAR